MTVLVSSSSEHIDADSVRSRPVLRAESEAVYAALLCGVLGAG
ncbi:MAG: hypothetical protein Q7T17_07710 [Microbacterium sp.]|nr:hypothetical protein [Microbacterium sp.]MDO8382848.1 hypothetical protein [Microbacterium sp.]